MRPYRGMTKEGKWVYGWYAKRCFAIGSSGPDMVSDIIIELDSLFPIEVIPETVGQQIGKQDVNGKEFYEDSVVHLQSQYETDEPIDCNVRVLFREGAFRLDFHNMLLNANIAASVGNWSTEIIGNIHENPELLKD